MRPMGVFGRVGIIFIVASIGLLSLPALMRSHMSPGMEVAQAQDKGLTQIKLQLRTVGDEFPKTDKSQYRSSEDVEVQVLATNSSSQPVFLIHHSYFVNYLPQLWRSGELVPYSKAMQQRLIESLRMEKNLADPNAIVRDSSIVVRLPANEQSRAGLIWLSSFYDILTPGLYEVRVKYRQPNGPAIESDTVMFEVIQ